MKIKYGFKKIYSNADKITVQAYGRDFMTFNKEDFGNDWQNLIDKGEIFDIEPLDVADLDKVTCTGTEIKKPEYDTETRNKWFNYARQFLDITDAKNEEKLNDIDFDKPIILCNKTASNNLNLFNDFVSRYRDSGVASEKEKYNKLLFDLSHFTFPSGDFIYTNPNGKTKSYTIRLGYITVLSSDNSFGGIIGTDKIVKIPSGYIDRLNGSLYGAFTNCSNLDVDCKSLIGIKPTSLSYAFYKCKSVKNINYIDLSNITSYSDLDSAFNSTELEEIPENFLSKMAELTSAKPFMYCKISYIDEVKDEHFLINTGNTISKINKLNINGYTFQYCGTINNINYIQNNYTSSYVSSYKTVISKIGVINSPNYSGFAFNSDSFPESVVAFPYYNFTSTFSIPNSTGYEYWADYIKEDTIACKNITERSLVISDHIDTLDSTLKNFKVKIPYNELLKAVANYNHTFEITELKSIFTNAKRTVTNAVYNSISFDNDTKEVIIDIDFTNIEDDSISTIRCSELGLYYTAKIDDYDFTGKTLVDLTIQYDFTINENVAMSLSLIDDDTEESENSTIADSSIDTTE